MSILNEEKFVQQQYSSDKNLSARYKLHDKHSTNKQGFLPWLFEQYIFEENDRILELGCGIAKQWEGRVSALPPGCELTLTDFSEGMVAAAKEHLSPCPDNIRFLQADIQDIPFDKDSFDVIIANHMLYHVPDLDKALFEVRRVLKAGGRFYSSTSSNGGIREYLHEVFKRFDSDTDLFSHGLSFHLENGGGILKRHFAQVEKRVYEDSLAITDTQDLMDWLGSSISVEDYPNERFSGLYDYFEEIRVRDGAIVISKEQGVFVCERY